MLPYVVFLWSRLYNGVWFIGLVEACYSSFSCLDHAIEYECDVLNKRGCARPIGAKRSNPSLYDGLSGISGTLL